MNQDPFSSTAYNATDNANFNMGSKIPKAKGIKISKPRVSKITAKVPRVKIKMPKATVKTRLPRAKVPAIGAGLKSFATHTRFGARSLAKAAMPRIRVKA